MKKKIFAIVFLFIDVFAKIPERTHRIFRHFYKLILPNSKKIWWEKYHHWNKFQSFLLWWFEIVILILEWFGVGEFYQILTEITKPNIRALKFSEKKLIVSIFKKSVNFSRIRLDDTSFLGPSWSKFAYVSGWQINSWGEMNDSWFIHEVTHVWQYQQMGAIYIAKALFAQWFLEDAYNYGGFEELKKRKFQHGVFGFNLEQQAEIAAAICWLQSGFVDDYSSEVKETFYAYRDAIRTIKRV